MCGYQQLTLQYVRMTVIGCLPGRTNQDSIHKRNCFSFVERNGRIGIIRKRRGSETMKERGVAVDDWRREGRRGWNGGAAIYKGRGRQYAGNDIEMKWDDAIAAELQRSEPRQ